VTFILLRTPLSPRMGVDLQASAMQPDRPRSSPSWVTLGMRGFSWAEVPQRPRRQGDKGPKFAVLRDMNGSLLAVAAQDAALISARGGRGHARPNQDPSSPRPLRANQGCRERASSRPRRRCRNARLCVAGKGGGLLEDADRRKECSLRQSGQHASGPARRSCDPAMARPRECSGSNGNRGCPPVAPIDQGCSIAPPSLVSFQHEQDCSSPGRRCA
jgi:hypothetical protein